MKKAFLAASCFFLASSAFAVVPFSLPWMNEGHTGAVYSSADHPHSVFVLEAFENFCPDCNENAQNVDELATAYQGNLHVQVLDLALDKYDSEIQKWIATHSPNHPVVKDVGGKIWAEYNEQYIPTVAIVDCQGKIVWKFAGFWDDSTKREIHNQIDTLLKTSCVSPQ